MIYSTHMLRHLRFIIGKNIRHHRGKRQLSLSKLACLSNINESRLDQFELGKNEIRLDELLKIACILEVQMEELIG